MSHVERAIESMNRQKFHWEQLIVHNASPLPMDEIVGRIDTSRFDNVGLIPYDPNDPPTCAEDWRKQMEHIGGTDRYLSHKADFYLADGVCEALDQLRAADNPWLMLFNKFDMKARASIETLREYASLPWDEALKLPTTGTYQNHLGKLAIPFHQTATIDGTMHCYNDEARAHYNPSVDECHMRWGVAESMRDLSKKIRVGCDNRFFALHMWHESPDRTDWNKNTSPQERF